MHYILLALIISACFGAYYFFIRIATAHINEVAGALILQVIATLVGITLILYLRYMRDETFLITQKGIFYACLAGVAIGLAEILTFFLYSRGVPVSVGTPLIVGGSIAVAALLGFLFLQETITLRSLIAMTLIICGIVLLTTQENVLR